MQSQAAPAPAPAPSEAQAALEPQRLALDQLEAIVAREGETEASLAQARTSLEPLRGELREAIESFEQRLSDVDTRLKQIGDPPGFGAPPEEAALAAERTRLTKRHVALDNGLKQARLLMLRADDIASRITDRRRALFTRELLARTSSALDPTFWTQAGRATPDELRSVVWLLQSWWNYARDNGGSGSMAAAALTLLALAVMAFLFARWLKAHPLRPALLGTRFAKSFFALAALLRNALVAPAIALAVVLVLDGFGLVPPRMMEIGLGLVAAIAIASFGRGVAIGLFAPDEPDRRLLAIKDETAKLTADHLTWAGRILGAVVFINVIQRVIVAQVSLTVATSAVLAALIAGLLCLFLIRVGRRADMADEDRAQWPRAAGWLLVIGIVLSLATGFVGLAAFLAGRFLVALGVIGALYIVLVFTETLFSEVLTANTPRGRAAAAFFGLKPRTIELMGTLLSAVIRVMLVLIVLLPLLGPWGIFAADFFGVVREATFGFRIGDVTISVSTILSAFAIVLIGVLATRALQGWLHTQLLPRTTLEPGLQNSVSTIIGYVGVIAALAIALAQLGLDLQKITLVAGALSIGIGFGLQSVVSNFVSGLILLAERPIRVGDIINVKGEEGRVHRIHVRATEIETADRASVIIPNSELITGLVKNWTHGNTFSRIVIRLGVAYDSDVEKVRDILLEIARAHPNVMQSPPPSVFLTGFGDSAINVELNAVVRNIADGAGAKSDICFSILARFRAEGVVMPYPQREITWREEPVAVGRKKAKPA